MPSAKPGFERFPTESPFIQLVGPYYFKHVDEKLVFALHIEERHCNSSGNLHGGMIGSVADIAIGHNIGMVIHDAASADPQPQSTPAFSIATVSMSTDFVGSAKMGEWVEIHVDVQKVGGSLAFANAYFVCGEVRIARVSAVFRIFRDRG